MENNGSLAIGILTWNAPKTLENTLRSYKRTGLLDFATEKLIFLQENNAQERKIAEEYDLTIYFSNKNIGIAEAYKELLEKSSCEYFLFLENDWVCVENTQTTTLRLNSAIYIIKNDIADCVRLRHRYHYGEPLHSRNAYEGKETEGLTHLLETVHWIDNPAKNFPEYISEIKITDENYFIANSKNSNYTNNPCIYKTKFIKTILYNDYTIELDHAELLSLNNYAKTKHVEQNKVSLEHNLQQWWEKQNFITIQGEGLFSHQPLNEKSINQKLVTKLKRFFFK